VIPRAEMFASRVSRMSADELRTRLTQEISKRWDWYLYKVGYRASEKYKPPFAFDRRTKFFFEAEQLPELTDALRNKLPHDADRIVLDAESICSHKFSLLGYEKLDFGTPIDWHFDPVHQKRVPLHPWFRINSLDFNTIGDHKIIWELNRHQHLVTLARAWLLTENERFVKEIVTQWYDWQRANPYPLGINWASTLEVAFRSMSWIWLKHLLEGCTHVPARFRSDLLSATAFNAWYIERFLSTYFSPNTHLIGEALALFFTGTLCPGVKPAARWRALGWKILLEEAQKQVRPDGVYFEQSLYYHVYALDFFLHARRLGELNKISIPGEFDAVLNRMWDVIQSLCQAGPPEGFGDDDGGRLFDPRRNRTEHMADPLALAAVMYKREDLPSAALTEEALWLFGNDALKHFDRHVADRPATSCAFRDGGLYISASEQGVPEQVVMDAGPQGTGKSGHGHADALSIRMSISGRRFLIDPGAGCYICPGDTRNRFRGTGAHNTIRIDSLDQAVSEAPFAWSSLPQVVADRWIVGRGFTFFSGHHTGYQRLQDPVLHRREVLHIPGTFCLVRDVLSGKSMHQLEIAWHLASDLAMERKQSAFVSRAMDASLILLTEGAASWSYEQESYDCSPAYGRFESAIRVVGRARLQLPAEHATLLITGKTETGRFERQETDGSARVYRYDEAAGVHYMIFSDRSEKWSCPPFSGDCRLVYALLQGGAVKRFILCDGSRFEFNGRPITQRADRVEFLEWDQRGGVMDTFSSDTAGVHPVS
jgi:Heparinase II/III-like protein/Heparinase II/III N-terminus